jgi:hypothetical protein
MRNKSTISFVKSGMVLGIMLTGTLFSQAQKSDTFTLISMPYYDEFGNLYNTKKEYTHLPTAKDSAEFNISTHKFIAEMMDSIKKADYRELIKKPIKKKPKYN